jgi:FixJ family two-component response regulator
MSHKATRTGVVVVDDDCQFRAAIGRLLRVEGFEPTLYDCAESFIKSSPGAEAPLCLILDVQLPGMSGLDLQERLRAGGSTVPIIITTGCREDAVREQAHRTGCAAFLRKPFDCSALLTALSSIQHTSEAM